MNEFNTYEFVVTQKVEGSALLKRILGIIGIVLGFLVPFVLLCVFNIPQFVAVLVLIYLPFVVFIWRFFKIEFEYSMTSGVMTFSRVYDSKSRKKLFEVTIKDFREIAPYTDEAKAHLEALPLDESHVFVSSLSAPDIYYAVFEEDQELHVVYFEATENALHILRYYNMLTKMSKVSR